MSKPSAAKLKIETNMNPELVKVIFLKLNRSQEHINDINLILKNSWDERKIEFSTRVCEDRLGYEVFTNDFSLNNFLEELGIRVGEFAHNLRTVLDNLVFASARTICDPPLKPKKLSFPIFENEEDFNSKTTDIFNQIPESVKQLIINAQPFSQKKNNPEFTSNLYVFSILHSLNNTDKHQTPKVLLAALKRIEMEGNFEIDNEDFEHIINVNDDFCSFFPILPNSKVFEFRTTEIITKMKMQFKLNVEVSLEVFDSNLNIDILQQIQNNVCEFVICYLENLGLKIEFENTKK